MAGWLLIYADIVLSEVQSRRGYCSLSEEIEAAGKEGERLFNSAPEKCSSVWI